LEDTASKGRSGRIIPMSEELRTALVEYSNTVYLPDSPFLIESERSKGMSPQHVDRDMPLPLHQVVQNLQ
jgi:hypothetical protein